MYFSEKKKALSLHLSRHVRKCAFRHVRPTGTQNQPAHSHNLIRVFIVRMKQHCILCYLKCVQWRFRSDKANAQTDLNCRWAYVSEGTFSHIMLISFPHFILRSRHSVKEENFFAKLNVSKTIFSDNLVQLFRWQNKYWYIGHAIPKVEKPWNKQGRSQDDFWGWGFDLIKLPYLLYLFGKIGWSNSEDPDKTPQNAVWSWSTLFATGLHCLHHIQQFYTLVEKNYKVKSKKCAHLG